MSGLSTYQPRNSFLRWLERRLPIGGLIHSSFVAYPTPRNLNYWWTFGGILAAMLAIQIITGVVLAMHYVPNVDLAFNSVESIMRDVNYGWLLRYMHANGASMFFLAVYIHMFRGMYYGSYKEPREVLWILGVIIYLLMMATGFMGYVLPWGQMSFWAATVITNLFSAIPGVGNTIVTWLWGGYAVGDPTLNRFYSLHYLLPFVIAGVVVLHIWALHVAGQNNPTGIEPQSDKDTVAFTPYATAKDAFGLAVFLIVFAWLIFYVPNYLMHSDNYIPANPSVTPAEIVPEWYYLPFYAILRSIPNKLLGVLALACSILVLAFLPWLDTSKVRSARYRPAYRLFFWLFVISCIGLGYLGAQRPEGIYVTLSRILTAYYFGFFFVIMPILGLVEKTKPLPKSITDDVLKRKGVVAALVLVVGFSAYFANSAPASAQEADTPPLNQWSFAGPFGQYDRAQLQRGFKVFHDVCSTCHGMQLLSFRNLSEPGGPEFTPAQVAVIASQYKYKDTNDKGEEIERPGRTADHLPPPATKFPTATPPDLSAIAKARGFKRGFPNFIFDFFTQYQEEGPDYIVGILTGYAPTPPGVQLATGLMYNKYFPGHGIAMPPPLSDGRVEYTDGTPQTLHQYALDVAAYLAWAAEPHMEQRKRIGMQVMLYLIVLAGLLYFTKRKVWHELEKPAEVARGQSPSGTTV